MRGHQALRAICPNQRSLLAKHGRLSHATHRPTDEGRGQMLMLMLQQAFGDRVSSNLTKLSSAPNRRRIRWGMMTFPNLRETEAVGAEPGLGSPAGQYANVSHPGHHLALAAATHCSVIHHSTFGQRPLPVPISRLHTQPTSLRTNELN